MVGISEKTPLCTTYAVIDGAVSANKGPVAVLRQEKGKGPKRSDKIEDIVRNESLGPVTSVELCDGVYIDISSSIAASSQTCFGVDKSAMQKLWREAAKEKLCDPKNTQAFREFLNNEPNWEQTVFGDTVPLHLMTWASLRYKDEITGVYKTVPVDFSDLAGVTLSDGRSTKRLSEATDKTLTQLQRDEKIQEVMREVGQRTRFHTEVIRRTFNSTTLPLINDELSRLLTKQGRGDLVFTIPPMSISDIRVWFLSGYQRELGQSWMEDTGDGPQSSQSFHENAGAFPDNAWLNELVKTQLGDGTSPTEPEISSRRQALLESINRVSPYGRIEIQPLESLSPELTAKQADAHTTQAFEVLEPYLVDLLHRCAHDAGIECMIASEQKRSGEEHFEMRVADGIHVRMGDQAVTHGDFIRIMSTFMRTMYDVWQDGKQAWKTYCITGDETQIDKVIMYHRLPPDFKRTLKQIIPTEKQLMLWIEEGQGNPEHTEALKKRLSSLRRWLDRIDQRMQNPDIDPALRAYYFWVQNLRANNPTNRRYTIVGVPGFGFTIKYDERGIRKFIVGPLLGRTGIGELFGLIYDRAESAPVTAPLSSN